MGFLQVSAFAAVSQYFEKKRAAAFSIVVSGASLGGILLPILLSSLLNASSLGFGWTVRIAGLATLPLMIFATTFVRPRLSPRTSKLFVWKTCRNPRFLLLCVALFFVQFGCFTPFFYLPTFAVEQGMDEALAGYLLAIANGTSVIGRIGPGLLADRFGKLNCFAIGSVASGLAIFFMSSARSTAGLVTYAVFLGISSGTIVAGASAAFSTCLDNSRHVGTCIGIGMASGGIGVLIGPPINGAIISTSGGYGLVCLLSGSMVVLGGLVAFVCKATTAEGLWGLV